MKKPHPGLSVRPNCLEPLGLTITEPTTHFGLTRKRLSTLADARTPITPEIALRLDKAFGDGART